MGGDGPSRRISFEGSDLKGVRVEERAIAGHIAKIIAEPVPPMGQWQTASSGIKYSGGSLQETVSEWSQEGVELYTLNANSERLWEDDSAIENIDQEYCEMGFFLSDDLDFTEDELQILSSETQMRSIGDVWIQGHLAIAAVHQILDMGIGINRP